MRGCVRVNPRRLAAAGTPVDELLAEVEVTPYTRSARTPSPRNRGRAILSAGGVCLDSVLQWWLRLLRVFPVCDSEPGSVFGPITGDPLSVTPSRERVVPVCNRDFLPADSPAHCLGAWPPLPPFSSFAEFSHGRTYDQTPTSLPPSPQRAAPNPPSKRSSVRCLTGAQRSKRSPASTKPRPKIDT